MLVGPAHENTPAMMNEGLRVSGENLLKERTPFQRQQGICQMHRLGKIMGGRDGIATVSFIGKSRADLPWTKGGLGVKK